MDTSSKRFSDGWDAEQHLAAETIELSKQKNETESSSSAMVAALTSPFKISATPCEDLRIQTLKCYEEAGVSKNLYSSSGIEECYKAAYQYQQCSNEYVSKHFSLCTALAEKNTASIASSSK